MKWILWIFPEADELGIDDEQGWSEMCDSAEGGLVQEINRFDNRDMAHKTAQIIAKKQNLTYEGK